jgi:flavin reductase (DIM6/NTAB) family NADH-FMN oxidoreductase RutF
LTADPAERVAAPLIRECHSTLECRLADDSLIDHYLSTARGHARFSWPRGPS